MGEGGGVVPAVSWLAAGMTRTATPKGRLTTGIHRLALRDWLLYDPAQAPTTLQLKNEMLGDPQTRPSVLQVSPDSRDAQLEVASMIFDHLPRRFPESFTAGNDGSITANATGERLEAVGEGAWETVESPLEMASRLVQEDFVILRDHTFVAGCVVSSFGRLAERHGLNLENIHKRVQGYEKDLHNPVTRFFNGLTVEKPCWRTNWAFTWHPSLKPHPERYPHRSAFAQGSKTTDSLTFMHDKMDQKGVGDAIWVKVEYQTFRRLEKNSDCVLFSVRTFVDPLNTIAKYPTAAKMLATNIKSIEGVEFRKYLGLDDGSVRERILEYVQAQATAG
eukprot:CAMPEP_0170188072 /NCGR_PEP_ID=MMETSP0040_2-20121228/43365_1 /TAXON_ID=641309 /ORGANISM="Lotharella oceanica, Strain CCMP622" /LENGTH=333 /DNA_ID=CAMNT_0010435261 /DNA_START=1 /DNA_END=1002 /DNA_ORIENTATION=+